MHAIPARKDDPGHEHFDVRFQLRAQHEDFVVSAESIDLAWVPLVDLQQYTEEESILRMRRKWIGPAEVGESAENRLIHRFNKSKGIMACDWKRHPLG